MKRRADTIFWMEAERGEIGPLDASDFLGAHGSELTPRERDCFLLIVYGGSYTSNASILGISPTRFGQILDRAIDRYGPPSPGDAGMREPRRPRPSQGGAALELDEPPGRPGEVP